MPEVTICGHTGVVSELKPPFCSKGRCIIKCVSVSSSLILYRCDTHLCLFHFLWVSPHCPWASPRLHCSFFPAWVLRDCRGVVPAFSSAFVTSVSCAAEVNVFLCCSWMGLVPLSPCFSSDCAFPAAGHKNLGWKGRSASKLINGNLITFLPTWNCQTVNFAPKMNSVGRF